MASLRHRLLVGTGLGFVVAFAATGAVAYALSRKNAVAHFEVLVADRARALADLVENERDALHSDIPERHLSQFAAGGTQYYELWDAAGTSVERSTSLASNHLVHQPDGLREITLPNGMPGLQATVAFVATPDAVATRELRGVLAFARDRGELDASLAELRTVVIASGGIATLLVLAVLAWIARAGLRSFDVLAQQIASLQLDARALPTELHPIAERLVAALERERTLTANIAHELRTPLAGMKSTLQLALSRDRTPERYREALATCVDVCNQLVRTVELLLSIARVRAGGERATTTSLRATLAPIADASPAITVTWHVADVTITAPAGALEHALANLVANAHTHGDGGAIAIAITETATHAEVAIENAVGAPSAEPHAGLGLALCRQLVAAARGTLTTEEIAGRFVVRLAIPRATSPSPIPSPPPASRPS